MDIQTYLTRKTQYLAQAGLSTARLDVLVLLEDATGLSRAHILAHPEQQLTDEQIHVLDEQINRRALHVPLAYIRGKTEFYGREFAINDYVLEPRPESETMIELLKKLVQPGKDWTIVDVGTGSGALAITAKLELPGTHVTAIDIDRNCLKLAEQNAKKLGANIQVVPGDLLEPLSTGQPQDYALLCNLPYVPDNFQINQAATHEPRLAIFGGPDGLDLYRELFRQANALPKEPAYILTEAMPPQHPKLADIATNYGFSLLTSDDFIQVFTATPGPLA